MDQLEGGGTWQKKGEAKLLERGGKRSATPLWLLPQPCKPE